MAEERTKLLAILSGVMVVGTSVLLFFHHPLIVDWRVIAVVLGVWLGISVVLRVKAKTWGRERPVIDFWSIPHFGIGVLLGLCGLSAGLVVGIATLWEAVEVVSRVREYKVNRVADLILAFAGWILANLLAAGPFTMW